MSQVRLVVEGRGNWVFTHAFGNSERVTIGRTADNDIELGDLHSSSHHAEIVKRDDKYFLVDLGSRNGTLLNGKKVDEIRLRNGDKIQIGRASMSFLSDEDDSFRSSVISIQTAAGGLKPDHALEPMLNRLQGLKKELGEKLTDSDARDLFAQSIEDLQEELKGAKQTIENLHTVNEMVAMLSGKTEDHELLAAAIKFVALKTEAENGFIMQIDPKTKKWSVRARHGNIADWAPNQGSQQIPLSITIVEKAVKSGRPVISQSAVEDPQFDEAKSIMALGIQSCLCYPMLSGGVPSGVVYVDRRTSPESFKKAEEKLCEVMVEQLNMILYPEG